MSDNRTTELLREGLTERGIEWENVGGTTSGDGITEWIVDGMTCRAAQRVTVGIEHLALYIPVLTPEQAIAATLGSDDRYDAGFANGVQAVFQQLEGIEDYEELQCFIAEYWGEGEGYDER